jgi:hypothetical protein
MSNGKKKIHAHIPIEGIEGAHITWHGTEPPSEHVLATLTDVAHKAFKMFNITENELKQRRCDHKWKDVYGGAHADCVKCGKQI